MNILVSLFTDFSTFSRYAPGVETNMDLTDLQSSGLTARKRVETVITPTVFASLLLEGEGSPLLEALRSAMANMTMATQLIFDSINRRKNKVDVYKYELEAMKRAYMENYSNALDTIIQLLMNAEVGEGDTTSPAALWRRSRYYGIIDACRIRSAAEFDSICPIDLSYLFFFRLLALQKEALDERLNVYYEKLTEANRTRLEPILNLALAKRTVAKSLRRFDILEFPPTIRNLFEENKAFRHGSTEHDNIIALASLLESESDTLIGNVEMLLSTGGSLDVSSNSAYNRPDDKIVMLP